ncbi:Chemotaxis response regulator protein-glutamate methylesterase [compost metagenome]
MESQGRMKRKRIVLADEQPLLRQAVRQLLEGDGQEIVGEADNGQDALHLVRRLEPELLVLDLALPRLGGLEVIRRLGQQGCPTRTLVLTTQDSEHFAGLCLQVGAAGFVSKQAPLDELREAVRNVLRGRSHFPAQSLGSVAPRSGPLDEPEQLSSLSPRELTVLQYLANGRSNKDIADELALSDRTVSTYKTRLLHKLHADSLVELVEIAWRNGMLGNLLLAEGLARGNGTAKDGASFRDIFDLIPQPISLRDREGRLLVCNRHYLELLDITLDEVVGKRIIDHDFLDPEEAQQFYRSYLQSVAREESYTREQVVNGRKGRRVLHLSGIPYRNGEGQLLGMLCMYIDITGHEHELVKLREAKERGDSLRHARAQFLYGVGQEFQRVLANVQRELAQVARELPGHAALREAGAALGGMQEQLGLLSDLVQLDTGALLLTPRPLDLVRLTCQEAEAFAPLVRIEPKGPPDAGGWIDPRRYRQMLRVLLEYGLERAPGLHLRMACEEQAHAELYWRLELLAEGEVYPGTPAFAAAAPQPRLALCQRLASLMDGDLELPEQGETLAVLQLNLPRTVKAV